MSSEQRYFAAGSTGDGFVNMFGDYFDPDKLDRLYIIKGGPGTGKSTVMKRLAAEAERRGYDPVRILCSSDPSSLDGVLVPELSLGIVDGTAPHQRDPVYPGAVDVIFDLYPFFNVGKLRSQREEIRRLSSLSAVLRKGAEKCRRFAALAMTERLAVTDQCCDREKLSSAAERCVSGIRGGSGVPEHRQISAYSTDGRTVLDTYERLCASKVAVCDEHGSAYIFMNELKKLLERAGIGFMYSTDALLPKNCDAILIKGDGRYFSVTGRAESIDRKAYGKVINMKRFVVKDRLKDVRGRLRLCERAAATLENEAARLTREAGRVHGRIEGIYKNAVDFDGVSRMTDELIRSVFPPVR